MWVGGHRSFGIDDVAMYPLFTPEAIEIMRRTIAPERQSQVATGVIVKARKPTPDPQTTPPVSRAPTARP